MAIADIGVPLLESTWHLTGLVECQEHSLGLPSPENSLWQKEPIEETRRWRYKKHDLTLKMRNTIPPGEFDRRFYFNSDQLRNPG